MKQLVQFLTILILLSSVVLSQEKAKNNSFPKFVPYQNNRTEQNVINKKIDIKDLGKEQPARWLSVDPMADKYPGWSPYNYCINNPLRVVDPDGNDIYINFYNADKDEKEQGVWYRDGNLYRQDGREYKGNNAFVLGVKGTLNQLLSLNDKRISSVINTLSAQTGRVHNVAFNDVFSSNSVTPEYAMEAELGIKQGSNIFLTLDQEWNDKDNVMFTPLVSVGHELSHAYDIDQGLNKGTYFSDGKLKKTGFPNLTKGDTRAVNFENRVRALTGFGYRSSYGGKMFPNGVLIKY